MNGIFAEIFEFLKNYEFSLFQLIEAISRLIEKEKVLGQNSLSLLIPVRSVKLYF